MVQKILDLNKTHTHMEEKEIHHLSPEELEAVKEGIWQIENGLFLSHEEANKRIDEVLKNNNFPNKRK